MRKVMLGGLLLALALACGGGGGSSGRIRIAEVGGDGSCSKLLDFCYRARCSLENMGSEPRTARLTYVWTQNDGRADKHVESVTLGAGELRTFTHDFKSAGRFAGEGKIECRVE